MIVVPHNSSPNVGSGFAEKIRVRVEFPVRTRPVGHVNESEHHTVTLSKRRPLCRTIR
jgi:hypothetical protein